MSHITPGTSGSLAWRTTELDLSVDHDESGWHMSLPVLHQKMGRSCEQAEIELRIWSWERMPGKEGESTRQGKT